MINDWKTVMISPPLSYLYILIYSQFSVGCFKRSVKFKQNPTEYLSYVSFYSGSSDHQDHPSLSTLNLNSLYDNINNHATVMYMQCSCTLSMFCWRCYLLGHGMEVGTCPSSTWLTQC